MKKKRSGRQSGFSLIELLIVIGLLSIIMGAVFGQIGEAQRNSSAEQVKMDLFQEAREFMDQMSRDLRSTGYPNPRNAQSGQFKDADGNVVAEPTSKYLAAGLVKVDYNELWFEGDVDGSGAVSVIHYKLDADGPHCPCLKRSQTLKIDGDPLTGQSPEDFQVEVQNVQNGGSAENPIFTAYLANGTVAKGTDGHSVNIIDDAPMMADINSVSISLTVQAQRADFRNGEKPTTMLVSTVRLSNCSQAHSSATNSAMGCQ